MTKRKVEQVEILGGNTKPPKIQCVQGKRWCFTFNNYTQEQLEQLEQSLKQAKVKYIFSRERGEEGTDHLQGYLESEKKMRPSQIKLPFRWNLIHWEKAKGGRKANVEYCSKERDIGPWGNNAYPRDPLWNQWFFTNGLKPGRKLKLIKPTYLWEQKILEDIVREPDDRTIHWIWSAQGNMGKTQFCKYLVVKHDACVLHGKGGDIRHGLAEWIKDKGKFPDVVVYPIPRCFNQEYLSYEGLENIKDMFFYSGKYEGGQVCGPSPHLYVFANTLPDTSKMSADRWIIENVDKNNN